MYATTHKQTKQKNSSLRRQIWMTTLRKFQNVNKELRLSIPKPMLTGRLTPK